MTPASKLSTRLQAVAQQFQPGLPVWDFCCDHGYLGEWALREQIYPEVHFVDPVPEIIERLENRVGPHLHEVKSHAFFHCQKGQDLKQIVAGNIAILGVGPHTIIHILEGLHAKGNLGKGTLVLGPQRNPEKLEFWLKSKGPAWQSFQEQVVVENQRERTLFTLRLKLPAALG